MSVSLSSCIFLNSNLMAADSICLSSASCLSATCLSSYLCLLPTSLSYSLLNRSISACRSLHFACDLFSFCSYSASRAFSMSDSLLELAEEVGDTLAEVKRGGGGGGGGGGGACL